MSHTQMLRPSYTAILAVTGTDDANSDDEVRHDPEAEAKRALLNHLLLERYGMDMGGRLGLNSTRGKLAEIYLKTAQGKSDAEKAKEAVKRVDAIIQTFHKALDTIRFPNAITRGQAR